MHAVSPCAAPQAKANNPQFFNVPDLPADSSTPQDANIRKIKVARKPRSSNAAANAVNASAARSQHNHHPASTRNRQRHQSLLNVTLSPGHQDFRTESPGLSLSPAQALPEPSTRAQLEGYMSPSPTKPSPSRSF
jgi:hypothetical protein